MAPTVLMVEDEPSVQGTLCAFLHYLGSPGGDRFGAVGNNSIGSGGVNWTPLALRVHYKKTWRYENSAMTGRIAGGLYFTDRPASRTAGAK